MSVWSRLSAPGGRWMPGSQKRRVEKPGEWLRGLAVLAVLVLFVWPAGGCDSASFAPPPPDEIQTAPGGAPPKFLAPPAASDVLLPPRAGAKAIALVLARHDPDDAEIVKSAARTQAGYDKVKLDITMLEDQDLPAQQAGLVHEALARNPLALILEPADTEDKRLAQAVSEAERQGVPVFFLYRPLSAALVDSQPSAATSAAPPRSAQISKPPVLVGAPAFGESAKLLVESAIRNAKKGGLDPKRGAILVVNTVSDAFAGDRATALREALRNAGIDAIDEIRFAYKADLANKIIAERLKANSKAVMVFGIDSQCIPAIRQTTSEPDLADRPLVVAGYVSDDRLIPFTMNGDIAALAEFNSTRLIRKAITAAASAGQGKDVPQHIDMPVNFHDSRPGTGVPKRRGEAPGVPRKAAG
ncbi:MAG: sugar ABC transporter substrate-binding protein [Isosphaeraceae bacterium]